MTVPQNLSGKAAVVTGAGRGIGRAVALALAQQGASVLVVDPGADRGGHEIEGTPAQQVVDEIRAFGGNASACMLPVDEYQAASDIIGRCIADFGRLDMVVNCAGVLRERMIWNLGEDDWDTVIRVHLKGHYNMCHHASKVMRGQRSGRIINFSSDAWRGSVGQANYAAAKGGIVSLTRALARELGRYGVTANAICPMAATRMTLDQGVIEGMKKRYEAGLITKARYESLIAMPGPEYIAPFICYLGTDAASDINGQIFHAEKGRVSIYSEPVEAKALLKTENDGMFTVEDFIVAVPSTLLMDYKNPAPAQAEE